MYKEKHLIHPYFVIFFYFVYGLVFMFIPEFPLSDLFPEEVKSKGAILMTRYVGLVYVCVGIILYVILTIPNRIIINLATLVFLLLGLFHVYAYYLVDSEWACYGFIINMLYALYLQLDTIKLTRNE